MRQNEAPVGRPPKCPRAREKYNKLKSTPTPSAKKKAEIKQRKAEAREEKRQQRMEAEYRKAEYRQRKAEDSYRAEAALRHYRGWSKQELLADAIDYGIADYRKDFRKMSTNQLKIWIYNHEREKGRA